MSLYSYFPVHLDEFEGPLDLLLLLIRAQDLDISKVSLSKITDSYLKAVYFLQENQFEDATEFLLMAATLIHLKSKALLPLANPVDHTQANTTKDEPQSLEELAEQLRLHALYLETGQKLSERPVLGEEVFTRPNKKPPLEKIWPSLDLTALAISYQENLLRSRKRGQLLKKETVSLTEKIRQFQQNLSLGECRPLSDFIEKSEDGTLIRDAKVISFLATLELGKRQKFRVFQELNYNPIYIELKSLIEDIDIELSKELQNEIERSGPS